MLMPISISNGSGCGCGCAGGGGFSVGTTGAAGAAGADVDAAEGVVVVGGRAGFVVVRVRWVLPPRTPGVVVVEAGVEAGKEVVVVGVVDPLNPDQKES